MFIGPYEHHSNELPWRESIADVIEIPEDDDGRIDVSALEGALQEHADRPVKIGSFSAASNVTGILSDTRAISVMLHRSGALSFWDFAAAAPVRRGRDGTASRGRGRRPRLQGRDLPVAPQVHRWAGHAGRAGGASRSVPQRRAQRARRRHGRVREPARARLSARHRTPGGRGHSGHRRFDPRRPRLPVEGRGRRRSDPRARGVLHAPGAASVGGRTRRSRCSAVTTCPRLSIVSFVVRHGAAICITTSWWRS